MSMNRKKEKAAAQKKETTRQLIGINDISDYGLKTSRGMLAFFSVKPTDRKSTRLNSSHPTTSRMPSSA